jgi:pimeloyl-ACP methyl ester carboxylesterase
VAEWVRVCSFDRPGYGWSDISPKPPLPSIHAEELHSLLQRAREKPPFVLVGHSLGGFDVLMYAHRYPEQVLGVVLVDSSHPGSYTQFGWRDRVGLRFFEFTAPFGLPRWRKWCLQGHPEIADQKAAFNCQPHIFKTNYQLWKAYPAASEEVVSIPSIGSIPLVVISRDPHRSHDAYLNQTTEQEWVRHQEDLLRLSSNSRHVIAQGSSHAVPVERPDTIVDQVRQLVIHLSGPTGQKRRLGRTEIHDA